MVAELGCIVMQTPLQTPIQTPLPGSGDGMYNIPTGPSDYSVSGNDGGNADGKGGRPSPYMVTSMLLSQLDCT